MQINYKPVQSADPDKYSYVQLHLEWDDLSEEAKAELQNKLKKIYPRSQLQYRFPVVPVELCVMRTGKGSRT